MKVLIVEDEVKLAEAIAQLCKEQKFLVDTVYDGQSAIDYASQVSYDVIILDVMLPKKDGHQVTKELRDQKNSTPILMLTARDAVMDKVAGLNSGADDYMTKPFSPEELIARINALSRRQGEVILNELTFLDLTLDLLSGDLSCMGQTVHLSFKEFEVLKKLMANPNMIISKDLLITDIWGSFAEAEDNNVEAYISFLRKKISFLKSQVVIKTLRKIGYRLENGENNA